MKVLEQIASAVTPEPLTDVGRDWPPQFEAFGDWSDETKPVAFMFGFNKWKRACVSYYLPDIRPVYCPMKWKLKTVQPHIDNESNKVIILWGFKGPEGIEEYAAAKEIPVYRMEDGFIRSVGLGAEHAMPYSLILDKRGLYFDSRQSSDLEHLLNTYNFQEDTSLLAEAREAMKMLNELHISKYNLYNNEKPDINQIYGPKTGKRILVVGQVEQDASIKYGCPKPVTNKVLLELAMEENPGADIIFKPHPDVLVGKQPALSDPSVYADRVKIVTDPLSIPDALKTIDHVYTITSLSGFEALIRGISVTTYGAPFYSGWGLTDDRSPVSRRQRKLTIEEVFAGSYLLYPMYVDPDTGEHLKAIDVIHRIHDQVKTIVAQPPVVPEHAPAVPASVSPLPLAPKKQDPLALALEQPLAALETPATASFNRLPVWFQPVAGAELTHEIRQERPLILTVATSANDGFDQVVQNLGLVQDFALRALDWIKPDFLPSAYEPVQMAAWQQPAEVIKLLVQRLTRLAPHTRAILLPEDISPLGRLVVQACHQVGIPSVVLPTQWPNPSSEHYYKHELTQLNVPNADYVLSWSQWQEDLFAQRGYPRSRMSRVGMPLIDLLQQDKPSLSKEQFCRVYGLNPGQATWLIVLPQQVSSTAQNWSALAIEDVVSWSKRHGAQVLLWKTGGNLDALASEEVVSRWRNLPNVSIEEGAYPLCTMRTALLHTQGVLGFGVDELIPAALLKQPVGLLAYETPAESQQATWQLPVLTKADDVASQLGLWQMPGHVASNDALLNALHQATSDHQEPGWVLEALNHWLRNVSLGQITLQTKPDLWSNFTGRASDWALQSVALPTKRKPTESGLPPQFAQILQALPARQWVPGIVKDQQWGTLFGVDAVVQFDQQVTSADANRVRLGKPRLVISDGFIQTGYKLPERNAPKLSMIIDDLAAYHETSQQPRLQMLLNGDWQLTHEEYHRSRQLIDRLNHLRITQYNYLPDPRVSVGVPGRDKVLVVNQSRQDPTVEGALAGQQQFVDMLNHVLSVHRDKDILVLQPPASAQEAGSTPWLSVEQLAITQAMENVHFIQYDIHPQALLDLVSDVYVVSSQLGFEALMRGKTVHCFGAPFYSNRGLTRDHLTVPNRQRQRTLEELFYVAYVVCSRYFDPVHQQMVSLEQLLDALQASRN